MFACRDNAMPLLSDSLVFLIAAGLTCADRDPLGSGRVFEGSLAYPDLSMCMMINGQLEGEGRKEEWGNEGSGYTRLVWRLTVPVQRHRSVYIAMWEIASSKFDAIKISNSKIFALYFVWRGIMWSTRNFAPAQNLPLCGNINHIIKWNSNENSHHTWTVTAREMYHTE